MTGPVTTEALAEALSDLISAFEVAEDGTVSVAPGRIASVALLNAQGVLDDTHIGPLAGEISDLELSVNGLEAALQQVTAERDEADRRAGAAEREAERDREDARKRSAWLHQAKQQAGYSTNVSFDKVWAETLEKAARSDAATSELARLRAEAAERQAADDALLLMNDGELEADPQKMIAHLQHACREFIRERNEWKASAKAEWATADRLRAEGEALREALSEAAETLTDMRTEDAEDGRPWEEGAIAHGVLRRCNTALARAATAREGAPPPFAHNPRQPRTLAEHGALLMTYDPQRRRQSALQNLDVRDLHWLLGALCVDGWFARRNVSGR